MSDNAELLEGRVRFKKWLARASEKELRKTAAKMEDWRDDEAGLRLGLIYRRLNKADDALSVISYVADKRYPGALYEYAMMHFDGLCMDQDVERGLQYLRFAMEEGSAEAAAQLGDFFSEGGIFELDLPSAAECYRFAVEKGDGYAALQLAKQFRNYGSADEKKEVEGLLRLAAEQGYPEAQYLYAMALRDGAGVVQDVQQAMKYFNLALEEGCPEAKRELERMFAGESRRSGGGALHQDWSERSISGACHYIIYPSCGEPVEFALENDRLVETNYPSSVMCLRGFMAACGGWKTVHLLLPDRTVSGSLVGGIISEMKTGKYAIASICETNQNDFLEIMFEDETPTPYSVALAKPAVAQFCSKADNGAVDMKLKVYCCASLEPVLTLPLRLRYVPRIPWGSQWERG